MELSAAHVNRFHQDAAQDHVEVSDHESVYDHMDSEDMAAYVPVFSAVFITLAFAAISRSAAVPCRSPLVSFLYAYLPGPT